MNVGYETSKYVGLGPSRSYEEIGDILYSFILEDRLAT